MFPMNRSKFFKCQAFVDTVGIKGADLIDKLLFKSFEAFQSAHL